MKYIVMLIIGSIIFTSVIPASQVWADENEGTEESQEEEPGSGFVGPVVPYYDFDISTRDISFGQLIEGEEYDGYMASLDVYNTGNIITEVIWSEYDPDDFFYVDAPSDNTMEVGSRCTFYFFPNGYLSEGTYSGNIVLSLQQDQSKSYCVNISATVVPGDPIVFDVDISPGYAEVSKGGNVQFGVSVEGYNLKDYGVNWSVQNNKSSGTNINGDGYLTIGNDETSNSITVVATSKDDNSTSDTATVSIKNNYYSVTARAEEGGQVSGGGSVEGGGSIELFASPNNGYDFDGWYENGNKVSSDKKLRIDNVSSDRSFSAKFARRLAYVITYSSPENGGTTSGDGYYNVGDRVTVKANPKDGYRFVCWKLGDEKVSKEKEYTLTNLNGEYRLKACFEACEYDVKVCVTPDNAGAIDGVSRYKENDKAVLKAYASDGYKFKGWFSDSKLLSESDTYTIDKVQKDYCLVAAFEKKTAKSYNMTSEAGNGGSIVPLGTYPVVEDSTVSYLITPDPGYKIEDVKVDGKSVGAVSAYAFPNLKSSHTVSVTFTKKEDKKTEKTDDHSKNDVQNVVAKPTGDSITESKKEHDSKTQEEQEALLSEIRDANEDINYDNLTGLLQKYNMSPDEAYMHLYDEIGDAMFAEAYREGIISFVVNNEYAPNTQATATNEFFSNPSMPNYWDVVNDCVTDEEAIGVLKGNKLEVHFDITDMTQLLTTTEKQDIFSYAEDNGLVVGNVFDITFLRTYHGVVDNVKQLDIEAEFVLQVPAGLLSEAQEFKILHVHDDGSKELLEDMDNDPATVTFRTSSFSNFAFAYAGNTTSITENTVEKSDNQSSNYISNSSTTDNRSKTMVFLVAVFIALVLTFALIVIAVNITNRKSGR